MSIYISKCINCKKYKRAIIDGFAAIKTAFGDDFDNRDFFIKKTYESALSSMTEDEESNTRLRVSTYTLKGVGTYSYRMPSVGYPRYIDIEHPGAMQETRLVEIYIDEVLEDKNEYNTVYIESYRKEESQRVIDNGEYASYDYC